MEQLSRCVRVRSGRFFLTPIPSLLISSHLHPQKYCHWWCAQRMGSLQLSSKVGLLRATCTTIFVFMQIAWHNSHISRWETPWTACWSLCYQLLWHRSSEPFCKLMASPNYQVFSTWEKMICQYYFAFCTGCGLRTGMGINRCPNTR